MVTIKTTSPLSVCTYDEQSQCYNALREISSEYRIEIELGARIMLASCGYVEVHEYPEQLQSVVSNILSWCRGFDKRLVKYIDSHPENDEPEEVTIPELLDWAPYMGIEEDELIACAEDMGIGW